MENQETEKKVVSGAKPMQPRENQETEVKVGSDTERSSKPMQTMKNQEPEVKDGSDAEISSDPVQNMEIQEPETKVGGDAESSSKPVQTMEIQESEEKVGIDGGSSSKPMQTMENQETVTEMGGGVGISSGSVNAEQSMQEKAWIYQELVRTTFEHQPETFKAYMSLVTEYENRRIRYDQLILGVQLLVVENKELLKALNPFIPKEWKGCFCLRGLDFVDAFSFAQKIQRRFSLEPKMYQCYLRIIDRYNQGIYDRADAFFQMFRLLEHHPDLLADYWKFLPPII